MKIENKDIVFCKQLTTSKGNQLKFKDNGRWYKADYLGYEGAAEYLSTKLLAHSNITNYVPYSLTNIVIPSISGQYTGCGSPNFLKPGQQLITADALMKKYVDFHFPTDFRKKPVKQQILEFVTAIEKITGIKEYGKILTIMLEFDRIICNNDRHFNNIVFIKNTDNSFCPAPVFDNGGAFLSDTTYDYPLPSNIYGLLSKVSAKPFSENFDEQVEICKELYGPQLQLEKNIPLDDAYEKIEDLYSPAVRQRMQTVYENQKFYYQEYFTDYINSDKQ